MPNSHKYYSRIVPIVAAAGCFALSGCAGGVSTKDVASYDNQLKAGDYQGAATSALAAGKIEPNGKSDNLLWSLNAGAALVYSGEPARSLPVFDFAENMIDQRARSSTKDMGQYRVKGFDHVMLEYYSAVAAMQPGGPDIARQQWKRTDDQASNAAEDFKSEINEIAKNETVPADFDVGTLFGKLNADPGVIKEKSSMSTFGAYKPFVNPAATYMSGLYSLNATNPDRDYARIAFTKVREVVGANSLLDSDLALAVKPGKMTPKTWVIFENGQGTTIAQYNVVIPVPIVGKNPKVSVATIALPRLQENTPAAQFLVVGAAGEKTTVVGNIDYVVRSEFQQRYPSIMRNAVLEAVTKIVLQNVAAQEKSGLALLAATVVSNVSTADVRSWSALPKNIQAARIETPADGVVTLRTDSGANLGSAKVPTDVSCIVYVKQMQAGTPASIKVLRF